MGTFVIISSPSGGGKNSVINALLPKFKDSTRLITTTTRPMRPGEKDGVDYVFISREKFEEKLAAGDFLEHNEYAGNLYGTDKRMLSNLVDGFAIVFSQIEVNGRANVKKAGIKHLSIFLMPESLDTLRKRIEARGGLTKEVIEERMTIAAGEMEAAKTYDHQVVNREGKFEDTVEEVYALIQSYIKVA